MVVWVKVGDRPDEGVLVDGLRWARVAIAGRLVSHVVDAVGLVGFAVGVHHGGAGLPAREAFFLAVPLLVAVPADDVGVPGSVVTRLTVVTGLTEVRVLGRESAITGSKRGDLLNFLLS